jgi:HPt (histidine-containing phosphotransfer) domain-containing protein
MRAELTMDDSRGPTMVADVLNEEIVDGIRAFGKVPGRLLQEMAASFLKEVPRLLAGIDQAGSLCEFGDACEMVHMLNGISSLIGAERTAKACEAVQRAVLREDPKGRKDALELLNYETGQALSAVERLIGYPR